MGTDRPVEDRLRTVRAPAPDWNAGMAFQTGIDAAVKNALAEAGRSLRDVKALDVVSIGLRGDELDEWERTFESRSSSTTSGTDRHTPHGWLPNVTVEAHSFPRFR